MKLLLFIWHISHPTAFLYKLRTPTIWSSWLEITGRVSVGMTESSITSKSSGVSDRKTIGGLEVGSYWLIQSEVDSKCGVSVGHSSLWYIHYHSCRWYIHYHSSWWYIHQNCPPYDEPYGDLTTSGDNWEVWLSLLCYLLFFLGILNWFYHIFNFFFHPIKRSEWF